MAALQTIREKAGILVSIVIGVALLAFIIGDAITSGASIINNERNAIGEINGESISIMTYQDKLNKEENSYKGRTGAALSEEAQRQLREQVWYSMIYSNVVSNEADILGMAVSDDEMYDMTFGNNISPLLFNTFGTQDPNEIRGIIQYVIQNPQAGFDWNGLQDQIKNNRLFEKYYKLVSSSFFTTSVEKADYTENMTRSYDVSYILKRYSTVADSTITISDADINDYYNKFPVEQEESRELTYVAFDINPTSEDRQKILNDLTAVKDQFAITTTPENFININSYNKNLPAYVSKEEIKNTELAEFIYTKQEGVFGPYEEDGFYKLTRGFESKMLPDSVKVRHILIGGQNIEAAKRTADSIMVAIKTGKTTFAEAAKENSQDNRSSENGGELGWMIDKGMPTNIAEAFFNAKKNELSSIATNYGVHIFEVTDKTVLKKKFKIASIDKEIRPSAATEMAATDLARTFAEGVSNAEELTEKAKKQGLSTYNAVVDKNEYEVNRMADSRELIRQAFMAEEAGEIITNNEKSPVFAFGNTRRVVAVLTKINEEGLVPLNNRSFQIRYELMNDEKGKIIANELQKIKNNCSSLISISNQTKIEVRDANNIVGASSQFAEAGFEPAVIGSLRGLKEGEISDPIIGNSGVYIIMVNKIQNNPLTAEQEKTEEQRRTYINNMMISQQLLPALAKAAEVKDYRYKFY